MPTRLVMNPEQVEDELCIYARGVDLWYNDGDGNTIQMTAGGLVNDSGSATVVASVEGLNTDNGDPANPIIEIAVDGVTITGDGTLASPLVGFGSIGSSDLTNQSAAIAATTIYAVPADGEGMYRVSYMATVTQAATTSCVLGGSAGFQVKFTDNNDSVVKTSNPTTVVSSAVNATGTAISGALYGFCKASTNLQYLFGYTSVGGTVMKYDLSIRVEKI